MNQAQPASDRTGLLAVLAAFLLWGWLPIYWGLLRHVTVLEVFAHRAIWAMVWAGVLIVLFGRTRAMLAVFSDHKTLGRLFVTSALVSVNWGLFIWAVDVGRVADASLGYYLTPMMNVAMGVFLLGERLTRLKMLAVVLALCGVANEIFLVGQLPWVSLLMGSTFAVYGYLRKTARVEALDGLFIEAVYMSVPALAWVLWLHWAGTGATVTTDMLTWGLLIGTGGATAVPLILYSVGARKLPLSTVGIISYIAPTGVFLCATFWFHEPFGPAKAVTFGFIWLALALYTASLLGLDRQRVSKAQPVE